MSSARTLVIGWFSFELMGATAGDLIAKDLTCNWLQEFGIVPDVAMWKPTAEREISTQAVVPENYDKVVFVCGPIGDGPPLNTFLDRFAHARKYALNVSLLQDLSEWNPFAAVVERDSTVRVNPDITFAAPASNVPVVGLILVGPQDEYPTQRHDLAERMFAEVTQERDISVVRIDTRLDLNLTGLRSPAQIESLISRTDAVLTTRLHGAAIALRRHVPPVVVDSIPGGTKLFRQMRRIGWPLVFHVGDLDAQRISDALDFALGEEARELAAKCAEAARKDILEVKREFLYGLGR